MDPRGWVRLYRSFFDSAIWQGPASVVRVALYCLQRANYKPGVLFDGMVVRRGAFVTSRENLARESRVTVQQARGAISTLAKLGFLTSETTNRYTLITVTNYDTYQGEATDGLQHDRKPFLSPSPVGIPCQRIR